MYSFHHRGVLSNNNSPPKARHRHQPYQLSHTRALCKRCFNARQNRLSPISPPPSLKLSNLSEDHIETSSHPQDLNSSLMFACVPRRTEQHALIETLPLPQTYLFCSCNRLSSSVPSTRGVFPISDRTPCRVCAYCAHRRRVLR
jgi:hypothetical protein